MAYADSDVPAVRALAHMRADWDRYRQLSTLVNHWDRPGWTSERRSYHWILRFDDKLAVRRLATHCQQHLRQLPTLDMVPATTLHLTLQRVAFTDEISLGEAQAVAVAARDQYAALPTVTTTVGPLAGSAGAVRFSVGPHQPIHRIRAVARAAIAQVRGSSALPARDTEFVPHVSIAYNNRPTEAQPVIAKVTALRALGVVKAVIGSVDLVEMRRVDRSYVWNVIASVSLAGPSQHTRHSARPSRTG